MCATAVSRDARVPTADGAHLCPDCDRALAVLGHNPEAALHRLSRLRFEPCDARVDAATVDLREVGIDSP